MNKSPCVQAKERCCQISGCTILCIHYLFISSYNITVEKYTNFVNLIFGGFLKFSLLYNNYTNILYNITYCSGTLTPICCSYVLSHHTSPCSFALVKIPPHILQTILGLNFYGLSIGLKHTYFYYLFLFCYS